MTEDKPFFQLVIEPVLCPARLQIQKAEDERAGKAEERGREGRRHAGKRRRQALLQRAQHVGRIAGAHAQRLNDRTDRADGSEKAPERSEEAEEDQQAGEVARRIARLIQTAGNRIEDRPECNCRNRNVPGPCEQHAHRRKQDRCAAGLVDAPRGTEGIEPPNFGAELQHMAEIQDDADEKDAQNEAVQARIGHEGGVGLPVEDGGNEGSQDDEDRHWPEIGHRARQLLDVALVLDDPIPFHRHIQFRHRLHTSSNLARG